MITTSYYTNRSLLRKPKFVGTNTFKGGPKIGVAIGDQNFW